jgi:hypothetical protein
VYDSDDGLIWSGTIGISYAISGVTTGTKTFNVAADLSAILSAGSKIRITGSTGNDGTYTVVSATFGASTAIVVVEAIPNATADGLIHPYDMTLDNPNIAVGQTVTISSFTYDAGEA